MSSIPVTVCHGNGPDHCCYIDSQPCPFLRENIVDGRRWACALYVEHGDWELVHADPRYLTQVQPHWIEHEIADCGDFEGSRDGRVKQCCFAEYRVE
jgi:hypothetical protein